jgi:hypothetical protein
MRMAYVLGPQKMWYMYIYGRTHVDARDSA